MKQILARLPRLTQQELATVRAACDHLLNKTQEVPILYTDMLTILGRKGPSYTSFQRTTAWKSWQKNLKEVESFIADLRPDWCPHMTRVQEGSLTYFLLQLLTDELKYLKVPVTIGTISSNLGRIPEVFDRSFPGYRAGGLAGKILSAMVKR